MKLNMWKMLAAAGSLAVLSSCHTVMRPYANTMTAEEISVNGPDSCRRLLIELASQTLPGEQRVYEVTGEDYEPESLVIAQMFPDVINISNTKIREEEKNGHRYITCRIDFERMKETGESGSFEREDEDIIGQHWKIGDMYTLMLGKETYRFRCVDDDYGDNSEYQTCALFLCETVIGSDVDSTDSKREILTFGRTNNYKTSRIREWLEQNFTEKEKELTSVKTGVNTAYLGATTPGNYEAFTENSFFRYELPVQTEEDSVFVLSLEEALKYKDLLWDVEGGGSSFSRGYWLRTPSYLEDETDEFCYGNWAYAVDLELGCIRPVEVTDGSIGIRPAFCLPQG